MGLAQPGRVVDLCEKLLAVLSPFQRKFLLDPSRRKLARCTRRAGKTFVVAAYLIYECLRAGNTPVLYAGLTRDSAKEAVWPILLRLLDDLQIPYTAKESALQIVFGNGSRITIFGCDQENARNRLRGRFYKLICFDETGFYSALDPLVQAVVPMLADLGGTLCLTSSPGELLQGLFYEADQGKTRDKWSRYFWSIHDNPWFQQPALDAQYQTRAEEELAVVLDASFNGDATAPGYRREWLGEWVSDHTALVYPTGPQNFIQAAYAMARHEHAIGISISPYVYGVVVGRYSEFAREFQIVRSVELEDHTLDDFASKLQKAREVYKTDVIVADTGDFTLDVVSALTKRYSIPVRALDKKDKAFHQKVFANDLQAGHIKIVEGLPIADRYAKIVKGDDGKEIVGQPNFAPNAALALYRSVYQTHLSTFTPQLSEEERHIKQLEDARYEEPLAWYEKIS